jgi:hypothetical protein
MVYVTAVLKYYIDVMFCLILEEMANFQKDDLLKTPIRAFWLFYVLTFWLVDVLEIDHFSY